MSNTVIELTGREKAKIWIVRFLKFNIVGFAVFLVGTAIFSGFSVFWSLDVADRQWHWEYTSVFAYQLF